MFQKEVHRVMNNVGMGTSRILICSAHRNSLHLQIIPCKLHVHARIRRSVGLMFPMLDLFAFSRLLQHTTVSFYLMLCCLDNQGHVGDLLWLTCICGSGYVCLCVHVYVCVCLP